MTYEYDPDNQADEKYRLGQARRLLACYEEAYGRPASTAKALQEWVAANLTRSPAMSWAGRRRCTKASASAEAG